MVGYLDELLGLNTTFSFNCNNRVDLGTIFGFALILCVFLAFRLLPAKNASINTAMEFSEVCSFSCELNSAFDSVKQKLDSSSYDMESCSTERSSSEGIMSDESNLELELGLTLWIDPQSKRSVSAKENSEEARNQVVGWPPVQSFRKNSLGLFFPKSNADEEDEEESATNCAGQQRKCCSNNNRKAYVKVNMDGVGIGRKIDLNSYRSYRALSRRLNDMFHCPTENGREYGEIEEEGIGRGTKYVLTYEDSEGDWMLVGDVPWMMFAQTAKRLRIMRISDLNDFDERQFKKKKLC